MAARLATVRRGRFTRSYTAAVSGPDAPTPIQAFLSSSSRQAARRARRSHPVVQTACPLKWPLSRGRLSFRAGPPLSRLETAPAALRGPALLLSRFPGVCKAWFERNR
jgi:hypothetical protein